MILMRQLAFLWLAGILCLYIIIVLLIFRYKESNNWWPSLIEFHHSMPVKVIVNSAVYFLNINNILLMPQLCLRLQLLQPLVFFHLFPSGSRVWSRMSGTKWKKFINQPGLEFSKILKSKFWPKSLQSKKCDWIKIWLKWNLGFKYFWELQPRFEQTNISQMCHVQSVFI